MPARLVPHRVGDFIFYYYAKLVIAPSAGMPGNYQFVVDRYKRLKSGEIHMSDYERELLRLASSPDVCAYCGARTKDAVPSEVVPRALGGPIGIHNLVMACQTCCHSKGSRDLVEWWTNGLGRDKGELPRVPAGLYLKIAYETHKVNFTLDLECHDISQIFRPIHST
jgi:hypothetical protein